MFWIVIALLLLCFFGLPNVGPIHHNYGYYPSGLITIVVIVLIVLLVSGRL
jgi:hypothetical protein